jgi:hypothetical protein
MKKTFFLSYTLLFFKNAQLHSFYYAPLRFLQNASSRIKNKGFLNACTIFAAKVLVFRIGGFI